MTLGDLRRRWRESGERTVPIRWVRICAALTLMCVTLVAFSSVGLVINQRADSRREVEAAEAATAAAAAVAEAANARQDYEDDLRAFDACIAAVVVRDGLRGILSTIIDGLVAVAGPTPSAGLTALIDQLRHDLETDYPPRTVAECGPEPVPPAPVPRRPPTADD
jgi:hypothetical protein